MATSNTRAKVKINNNLAFTHGWGAKQGDGLSNVNFNCAQKKVIKWIKQNGNTSIFFKFTQLCPYADDMVAILLLKGVYKEMEQEARKIGLMVNEDKTQYIKLNSSETIRPLQELIIGDRNFEVVKELKYFGMVLSNKNEMSEYIRERIHQGNRAYYANTRLVKKHIN